MFLTVTVLIFLVICLICLYLKLKAGYAELNKENNRLNDDNIALREKYRLIDDVYSTLNKLDKEYEYEQIKIENIRKDYKEKYQLFCELRDKIELYNAETEIIECGLYKPVFNFQTSNVYKQQISENYEKQKQLINEDEAVLCNVEWIVSGSKSQGAKMINKEKTLILKAFNAQCDMEIGHIKWNNAGLIEKRILKSYTELNKIGSFHDIEISSDYLALKKEQLWLTYEYQQKLYQEREEQKERREQMREEQKLLEEAEKARKQREEEEKQKAELERIRQEAYEQGLLDKAQECEAQIAKLEEDIENNKRTESNAEKGIKQGHIYIISNVGSFGENIYKIGMTRRNDPTERVDELGNASVPFNFYIHGLIKSENAPELENQLHKAFEENRVNKVNSRKEFFKVSLDEIECKVNNLMGTDYIFSRQIDTQDYLRTIEIIKSTDNMRNINKSAEVMPQEI